MQEDVIKGAIETMHRTGRLDLPPELEALHQSVRTRTRSRARAAHPTGSSTLPRDTSLDSRRSGSSAAKGSPLPGRAPLIAPGGAPSLVPGRAGSVVRPGSTAYSPGSTAYSSSATRPMSARVQGTGATAVQRAGRSMSRASMPRDGQPGTCSLPDQLLLRGELLGA